MFIYTLRLTPKASATLHTEFAHHNGVSMLAQLRDMNWTYSVQTNNNKLVVLISLNDSINGAVM